MEPKPEDAVRSYQQQCLLTEAITPVLIVLGRGALALTLRIGLVVW